MSLSTTDSVRPSAKSGTLSRIGRWIRLLWFAVLLLSITAPTPEAAPPATERGEVLYNGIHLPSPWPPRREVPAGDSSTVGAMSLPYLTSPPEVIPIDVGRQLFVDDFLVEHTTLKRNFHAAEPYAGNPVLKPDRSWELGPKGPMAIVFSDGVWYDPQDRLYKMWYMCGYVGSTCYATSRDGVQWEKPTLDVQPGTNIVHPGIRDSSTVWLDLEEKDPHRRYKYLYDRCWTEKGCWVTLRFSADGIHWGDPVAISPPLGDRTTFFWNPFRRVWVLSIRDAVWDGVGRFRRYWEHSDVIGSVQFEPEGTVWWVSADRLDLPDSEIKLPPQLYNLDAIAYESLMLGLFSIWRGEDSKSSKERPKRNEIFLAFSRDGFHWDRPDRRPFIGVSERRGSWNWGNVQSAGGGSLVVRDKLYFYFSGRAGRASSPAVHHDAAGSTGLAFLRRDGFASMEAGEAEGTLTTRPITFQGKHLFVNVDASGGEFRVEALNLNGQVISPYSRENCLPLRVDSTAQAVRWKGAKDLATLAAEKVRFRFYLRKARLYSFWVSPERSGASHGYVAAGGPGFTLATDTVGSGVHQR